MNYKTENIWKSVDAETEDEIQRFSDQYASFMDENRTEREFIRSTVKFLEDKGFKELSEVETLNSGSKLYALNREGAVLAAVIGKEKLNQGINLIGAHVDAPRIDLKPRPLFEEKELAFFTTHYYGGIRKYQWVTLPLALHGVIVKQDGSRVNLAVGMKPEDPVFYITDLLPHFAGKQREKKLKEAIKAEQLNVLVGSRPAAEDKSESENSKQGDNELTPVKENLLKLIKARYDLEEEDLISAELQLVPAQKSRDVGLDETLLGSYAHDDRVCSYTALRALTAVENPEKTAAIILVDREEVGSMGSTGMQSRFFENALARILTRSSSDYSDLLLRETLENSTALSGDVTAGFDPDFAEIASRNNTPLLNHGINMTPYTGARGKGGASEAPAEFRSRIRRIWNENQVAWQASEMGEVDKGGGGTIAKFLANYNISVLDCGPAVLSMHSPFELVSKADIYHTWLAFKSYLES